MNEDKRYILVTPVRDEAENLRILISSVVNQLMPPSLWVIVDDGSEDNSFEIIEEAATAYSWIKCLKMQGGRRQLGSHYAGVVKNGFDFAIEYCAKKRMQYGFIALLDADISVDNNYFERCIKKFSEHPLLGIASGSIYVKHRNRLRRERSDLEWPRGGARIWRRSCFEKTGYSIVSSADAVSTIKAKNKGYQTAQFKEIIAVQSRPTSKGQGFWRGFIYNGRTRFYLGYTPLFALACAVKYLFTYPFYIGIAFSIGYFEGYLLGNHRINDTEVLNFCKYRFASKIKTQVSKISRLLYGLM